LDSADAAQRREESDATNYQSWLSAKYRWVDILSEVRNALVAAEAKARPAPDIDVGIWIQSFKMGNVSKGDFATEEQAEEEEAKPSNPYQMSPELMRRYGLMPQAAQPTGEGGEEGAAATETAAATPKKKASTNEISEIEVVLKAVNLASLSPTRNLHIAAAVEQELRANALFDPATTRLGKQSPPEEGSPTFTFELTLGLKDPIKL
jgi:hypothetical protein